MSPINKALYREPYIRPYINIEALYVEPYYIEPYIDPYKYGPCMHLAVDVNSYKACV